MLYLFFCSMKLSVDKAWYALNRDYESKIFKLFSRKFRVFPLIISVQKMAGCLPPSGLTVDRDPKAMYLFIFFLFIGTSIAVLVASLRCKDSWQLRIIQKRVFWPDLGTNQLAGFGQNLQFSIGRPNIERSRLLQGSELYYFKAVKNL